MVTTKTINNWDLTRYFVPLAIQAIAQAFSHPLVAMVASRGPGGPLNLAGLAQSGTVMFFLGIFAIYYMTTGMVYARTKEGFQKFWAVCIWTGFISMVLQGILGLPWVAHIIFGRLIGLPPSIEYPAQIALLACMPLQFLFFWRIPYQVAMYNGNAPGRASLATIMRIVLTALLSAVFCSTGLVGPLWAVVCLTIPVFLEAVMSMVFARPFLNRIQPSRSRVPRAREIFFFNLPLSMGGYFLVFSALFLSAIIARTPDPERVLPVYFVALGLANPLSFAATRIQALALAFPADSKGGGLTLRFTLSAGAFLGLLPLIFTLPGLIELYYVDLQKIDPADLSLVRITAVALIFFPMSVAIRAHYEGIAAWLKKPLTVLIGNAFYMISIVASGYALLAVDVPGYLIGPMGLTTGSLISAVTIRVSLNWVKEKEIPMGMTTTSVGQIR